MSTVNVNETETVVFYNVENLFSPDPIPVHKFDPSASGLNNWDERKYQQKLAKIAAVFQLILEDTSSLPLIIGLAEIGGEKPLKDLILLEPFNGRYGVIHYESMDERGVDVALLYRTEAVEVLSSEPITYFFTVEKEHSSYYDTTRDVLFCKLKIDNLR